MAAKKDILKLTAKQQRFCENYLIDLNATQAAIRAGYSKKTARSQGQRLLTNVDIQDQISNLQKEARKTTEITREEVLSTLAAIMRAKLPDYFKDGKKMDLEKLTEGQKLALESIRVTKSSFSVKLTSKIAAIERINAMLGFNEPLDIKMTYKKMPESQLNFIIEELVEKSKTHG